MKPYIAAALCLVMLAACNRDRDVNFEASPTAGETQAERDSAVRNAFREPPTKDAASAAVVADIQKVFDRLTSAGQKYDATRALKFVSLEHLLDVALATYDIEVTNLERDQMLRDVRSDVRKSWFEKGDGTFDWRESTVMRVQLSDDGTIALAYVRHRLDDYGTLDKARWWLVRIDGAWLVYDWEYVTTCIRTSRDWGRSISLSNSLSVPRWVSGRDHLGDSRMRMAEGDYEQAKRILKSGESSGYPADLEAVRLQYMSICHWELGENAECLDTANRSLKKSPDFPEAHFYRARGLAALGRHEEAVEEFEWYIETLGSDPTAMSEMGDSLMALERVPEAREMYRSSLRDFATWHAIAGLAKCLDKDDYSELGEWFAKLVSPETVYPAIASTVYYDVIDNGAIKAINEAYRKIKPQDTELAWYTAMVALDDEDYARAATALKPAIGRVTGEDRDAYQNWYWTAMAKDGRGTDALKEAGGSEDTFNYLAGVLLEFWNGEYLNQLCEAWREGHETEHSLHFYLGEADFILEDYAAAEEHFRTGHGMAVPRDDLYEGLWHGLVDCMQKQGKVKEAYDEFSGGADVFRYLADRLIDAENVEEFEKLLAVHVEKNPQHWYVPRYKGELAYLKKDWKTAATQFELFFEKQQKLANDEPWVVLSRCVRSSIRAGDTSKAIRRARIGHGEPDKYLLIIAHAAAGDTAEARKAVDAYVEWTGEEYARYWIEELYKDEDAGEKLRQPAYADIHKRFPIPEPEPEGE